MPCLICLREKLWTRTYHIGDQVPTCPVFTRAKIKVPFWDFSQFAVTPVFIRKCLIQPTWICQSISCHFSLSNKCFDMFLLVLLGWFFYVSNTSTCLTSLSEFTLLASSFRNLFPYLYFDTSSFTMFSNLLQF